MASDEELAALVALLREGGRAWARYIVEVRRAGGTGTVSAQAILERELGLLAYEAHANASAELAAWRVRGLSVISMVDPDYPYNLRVVENRPPLLFIAGSQTPADKQSVAVIGTREPTDSGRQLAATVAGALSAAGYVVFSGLAAGIDSCVHVAVLERRGRTVAVIGTGHDHAYPGENAALQERIAAEGAVVSQFWPESPATRQSFPTRNALMSGLTLGSVIIEASATSGTRIQARHALAQGRKVILMGPVLGQEWAVELSQQAGVTVAQTAEDVIAALRS